MVRHSEILVEAGVVGDSPTPASHGDGLLEDHLMVTWVKGVIVSVLPLPGLASWTRLVAGMLAPRPSGEHDAHTPLAVGIGGGAG